MNNKVNRVLHVMLGCTYMIKNINDFSIFNYIGMLYKDGMISTVENQHIKKYVFNNYHNSMSCKYMLDWIYSNGIRPSRNIKELLELILENENLFDDCLCRWYTILLQKDIIDYSEFHIIRHFIDKHRPLNVDRYSNWWEKGLIEPRINFIKEQIRILS